MTEKLKILHVTPCFYPAWSYGGIPRVVYELSRELAKRGHGVEVYTTDVLDRSSRYHSGEERIDGVKAHYFRNLSNSLAYNFQVYLPTGLFSRMGRTIADFDILHLHGHRNFLNNIARHWAKKFHKPYILSAHGTVLRIERRVTAKKVFDAFFGNGVLEDAAHFTAVAESEVDQYELMGIKKDDVTVVNNGIDIDAFGKLPERGGFRKKYNIGGKKMALFLGKITPRKGVDFLARAFAELKREDAILVIAGNDMGFKKNVEEIIKVKGIGERVIFTGLLAGEEKLAAYRDADLLVYPAIYEIFGLVPFEAILCSTPVIVTDDCGCGEIINRENIGYTVKYNNILGLRDKINEVFEDKTGAAEKVERGKRFIALNLGWGKIASEFEKIYDRFSGKVLLP